MSIIRQIVIQDPGDPERLARLDPVLNAIITISASRYLTHTGGSFFCTAVAESLGNNDTLILVFKTPPVLAALYQNSYHVHLVMDFNTRAGGVLDIWEGVTWDTGSGTLAPIVNHKRSAPSPISLVLEDLTDTPNFTATGNMLIDVTGLDTTGAVNIFKEHVWGDKRNTTESLGNRVARILKEDTSHAVVFTSSSPLNSAQIFMNWHEVEEE